MCLIKTGFPLKVWIVILASPFSGVFAQDKGVNWPTVGTTYGLILATALLIVLGYFLWKYTKRKNRNKSPIHRANQYESQRSCRSGASANTRVTILSSTSTDPRTSYLSNAPLVGSGGPNGNIYRNLPRSVSQEPERPNRRRTGDFTSKWCTEQGLSESTAQTLRQNGFVTEATLKSLRPEDVFAIGLASRAEECLLRQKLEELYPRKSRKYSEEEPLPRSKKYMQKRAASSSELPHSHSSSSTSPDVGTALLDRAYSETELDESDLQQFQAGLKPKSTAHSYEVIEEEKSGMFGARSAIELQPGPSQTVFKYPKNNGQHAPNNKGFNGLLSDKGLHTIAHDLGHEWPELAALLSIRNSLIQKIKMDHANQTHQQIYEMLRLYRDSASGTKSEIKGQLQVALEKVSRRDIANQLLQEEVDGSIEKIPYHSIV